MDGTIIPIILAILGLIAGLIANRTIRRGSARFYALEREALLRRASFFTLASVVLFATAIGLLAYNVRQSSVEATDQQTVNNTAATIASSSDTSVIVPTSAPVVVQDQPSTAVPTATVDPNLPTPTATPIIRRAVVENTWGSGVYLRARAGTNAEELEILDEQTIVTLIDSEEPIDANGFNWVKVRTVSGEEGWVADLYLTVTER